MYNIAIVEDNEDAVFILENYIKRSFPNYRIVYKCCSLEEAVTKIVIDEIDLLFLDIGLVEKSGFDFLMLYPDAKFQTIITSGSENHAVRAFKFNVADYLLKPYSLVELKQSLLRFEQRASGNSTADANKDKDKTISPAVGSYLIVKTFSQTLFIPKEKISFIEANGPYSTVHYDGKKTVCSKTLSDLEKKIHSDTFFRCNRSYLVNLNAIAGMVKLPDRFVEVILTDGSKFTVPEVSKQKILEKLGAL